MQRRSVVVVLTVAVLVLVTFGVRALIEPYTDEGRAQDYFESRIDTMGELLAISWRGGRFTAATAEETKGRVLKAAENDFAVVLLGAADNGEVNWVVLNLLTHYDRGGFGLSLSPFAGPSEYTVTGCVRFTVTHGRAGWAETDAHLTVKSVPCPPGAPVPVRTRPYPMKDGSAYIYYGPDRADGSSSPAYPGVRLYGPTFRVDDVSSRVFPIMSNPLQCRSGGDSSECPGG